MSLKSQSGPVAKLSLFQQSYENVGIITALFFSCPSGPPAEFGGTVGCLLFLSNCFGIAMYVLAFGALLKHREALHKSAPPAPLTLAATPSEPETAETTETKKSQ